MSYSHPHCVGVLLIHGFSSTPVVFDEFKKRLDDEGFDYRSPTMAGHGTDPDDLAKTTIVDWIASVEHDLFELKKNHPKVVVVGVSMGGNIACALAARHHVDGVALVATPRWLKRQRFIAFMTPVLRMFGRTYYHKKFRKQLPEGLIIGGPTASYASLQLKSVSDVLYMINIETPKLVKKVTAPTLIIQSDHDGLVQSRSGKYFYSHVGAKDKQLIWISKPHHAIHLEAELHNYIIDFIRRVSK